MLTPVDMPGADCGDIASVSSKKGFVDRGRSGRFDETDPATEGERARFRKGLLEPKLAAVGEAWCSVGRSDALNQPRVLNKCRFWTRKSREGIILRIRGSNHPQR